MGRQPKLWLTTAALLAAALPLLAADDRNALPAAATSVPRALEDEIAAAATQSGGIVGVAAWRLDGNGPRVLVNAAQSFPMASTFKVAVGAAVFALVDAGRIDLKQVLPVDPNRLVASDVIADRLIHPGVSLSVHNLLELMLAESDNTATDMLVELAGGPTAVTAWVRGQGIGGQRVDRDTTGILRDFFGLPPGPFPQTVAAAEKADPKLLEKGSRPNPAFDEDPRDTSTPEAMSTLLARIFNGQALSPASTAELTTIMMRCRTGEGRLKGRLPAGSVVAHKTGTVGGSLNDVGVITLPANRGTVVISVFVKKSSLPFEQRELAIAEIARAVRDYYLFNTAP
jgi:beta-lactamase class A